MEKHVKYVGIAALICVLAGAGHAQSTVGYSAGPGQRDVQFGSAPVPDGNQVQIGYFDSGFDVLGNSGNIFALGTAWHELAFTNITTIFGQAGRFGSTASTTDPQFDGQKICLWLFKTSNNGAPLANFSNVQGYGVFSSTAATWLFPSQSALPPNNTTSINSSDVDQAYHGVYDFNHLTLTAVPEPGTLALLGIAGAVLLFGRWQRRGPR